MHHWHVLTHTHTHTLTHTIRHTGMVQKYKSHRIIHRSFILWLFVTRLTETRHANLLKRISRRKMRCKNNTGWQGQEDWEKNRKKASTAARRRSCIAVNTDISKSPFFLRSPSFCRRLNSQNILKKHAIPVSVLKSVTLKTATYK